MSKTPPRVPSVVRTNLTFWFDPTKISREDLVDRLDAVLVEQFHDVEDWNARWVSDLSQSPLFGAATKRPPRSDGGGVALPDEDMALIRLPLVLSLFPVGKSSWWNGIAEGRYPKPIRLGKRAVAWRVGDVKKLLSSLPTTAQARRSYG